MAAYIAPITWLNYFSAQIIYQGGAVASWLVSLTPYRAVRVRALVGDIVLCSWARHMTPTVPLSTQVHKWVPANVTLDGLASHPGRSRNIPSRLMLQKPR